MSNTICNYSLNQTIMKIIHTSLLLLILVGLTSSLSAEEVQYDGQIAGRPITFWIDWQSDGKLSGNYWFDGHSQSFLGNRLSEGAIRLTDDDGDQVILRRVSAQGSVFWRGVVRGGQFNGEDIWFIRTRSTSSR
jgi:hypothetical protein